MLLLCEGYTDDILYGAGEEDGECGGGDMRVEGGGGLLSALYRAMWWAAMVPLRLRINLDLRDSAEDGSLRMLNAILRMLNAIETGGAG